MTELETLERAAMYVKKMANGINPLTDAAIDDGDLVNNVRISRCLFYVADVLDKVIKNNSIIEQPKKARKMPYTLSTEDLKKFRYSNTPIALSSIADLFNELIDTDNMRKMSYKVLADWLVSQGILVVVEDGDGKTKKAPTDKGLSMGLSTIQKISQKGNEYDVIVYDIEAQRFIVQSIPNILNSQK